MSILQAFQGITVSQNYFLGSDLAEVFKRTVLGKNPIEKIINGAYLSVSGGSQSAKDYEANMIAEARKTYYFLTNSNGITHEGALGLLLKIKVNLDCANIAGGCDTSGKDKKYDLWVLDKQWDDNPLDPKCKSNAQIQFELDSAIKRAERFSPIFYSRYIPVYQME